MPDISKCSGEGCKLKTMCYRYTSKPSPYRQAYFTEPPYKDNKCEMFWGEASKQLMDHLKDIVKG